MSFTRLVAAEWLKLRKRRALVASTLALTVAPIVAGYAVLAVLHAVDPDEYGPAGGVDNFAGLLGLLTQVGAVAAVLVGVNAGTGDLAAGVFRELVVTGRSRLALFGARIPGGLAFLLTPVGAALAIATAASIAFAGSEPAPGLRQTAERAAWVVLVIGVSFVLALGVSSLLGSRATSIALLLAWQLAVAPMLLQTGKLDPVLLGAALARLEPGSTASSLSVKAAIPLIAAWTILPLAAGAWRTQTRDA